ncbi:MAG: FGGY-family carbohydrate kinase [Planctomycetota bacterium]
MKVLALDIGSSSAKAAIVVDGEIVGSVLREPFRTDTQGVKVSVTAQELLRAAFAVLGAIDGTGVDVLALTGMSPAWLAMGPNGKELSDIITHADRRSVAQAHAIEAALGRDDHLRRVGNRPFPGGISSTSCKWFADNHGMSGVDLVGHITTLLHTSLTGARVMDVSNAGFTGLWRVDGTGWDEELVDLVGLKMSQLPSVVDSGEVVGKLLPGASVVLKLPEGLPVTAGMVDGSGALLLAGARPGQLVNSAGSTDVLAVCLDHPEPRADLLTRPLGIGRKWVSAATEAAAGSTIAWARRELFRDLDDAAFERLLTQTRSTDVAFDLRLAGSRTEIDQPTGGMSGLTLGSTRDDILGAIVAALDRSRRERLAKLESLGTPLLDDVILTGGGATPHPWTDRFNVRLEEEATLCGAALATQQGSAA